MCLITFAYKIHPEYKLILAANRDEFYGRATRKAQFWEDEGHPDILAGKDLEADGTWMGTTKGRMWSALTNYRDPSWERKDPPSRGHLVLNYLKESESPKQFSKGLVSNTDHYMGFNILVGDPDEIYHYSNKTDKLTLIEPGIHGVSNALLNTSWPKMDWAKKDLERIISKNEFSNEELFDLLSNSERAPEDQLPDTGIPEEWEKAVSSVFIKTETYGTRCSTLLLIDKKDNITFMERRYDPSDQSIIESTRFDL